MGGEVRSMRGLVVAIGALVIAAGCGRVPGGSLPAGDYKLYEAATTGSSQHVAVIDSLSHSVELNLPLGTPSPDWTHFFTVSSNRLLDLDPRTGASLHSLQLPGYFRLPPATISGVPGGLSPDGRWLVLEAFDSKPSNVPSATHLLVVDTTYSKPLKRIDLGGYYQFDAISNDGQRIYLIEYLSSNEYHVRFYEVGIDRLNPAAVFDKSDGSATMAGLRLSGVSSPDGHWLYSMYIRQDKGPFIHALSLDNAIAFCIDLPGFGYASGNGDAEFHWSLALSRDGSHLYAANGALGIVAQLNTRGNAPTSVTRTGRVATDTPAVSILAQDVEAKELGANGAALSPDGRTLVMSGATGVVWVDTATLRAQGRQLANWRVWSLALSPDGNMLYAVNDAGMIAEMSMTGPHSATIFGGAPGRPMALIRVESVSGP